MNYTDLSSLNLPNLELSGAHAVIPAVDSMNDSQKASAIYSAIENVVKSADESDYGGLSLEKVKQKLAEFKNEDGNIDGKHLNNLSSLYLHLTSFTLKKDFENMKLSDRLNSLNLGSDYDSSSGFSLDDSVKSSIDSFDSSLSQGNIQSDQVDKGITLINLLISEWKVKMKDTKSELEKIYGRLHLSSDSSGIVSTADVNSFNSPEQMAKANYAIGKMNSFHTLVTNTLAKIFSGISSIVMRM